MQHNHSTSIDQRQQADAGLVSIYRFLEQQDVRVLIRPDQTVWFVAADVCAALDLSNPTMALRLLDDDEHALNSIEGISRGNSMTNIVSESGLYSLILTSRKPEAKPFKDWVTKQVLPAIRQQGYYFAGGALTRERVQMVKLARQLTLDVAKSKDGFSKMMLRGLLGEVATALGHPLPPDPEIDRLEQEAEFAAKQPLLPGVN